MQKTTLIILGILAALAAVVFLLIWPAIDELGETNSYFNEQEARLNEIKEIATKIEDLNKKYEGNIEELEKIMSILPKEQELAALLIQLENLASANGLIMESIDFTQPQQTAKVTTPKISLESEELFPKKTEVSETQISAQTSQTQEPYKILAVSLKLTGSYNAFKNYLQSVEKNLRLMDVISLGFVSQAGQEATLSSFSFKINLNVYYQ